MEQTQEVAVAAKSSCSLGDPMGMDWSDVLEAYYSTDGLWYPAKVIEKIDAANDTDDPQQVVATKV